MVAINAVAGTIIAWVLVRDEFPGKRIVNSLIDLPFALPTIVAGITLLALYGDNGVLGLSGVSFTRVGVVMALLFVTLPFVIRSVQPVLLELDTRHGGGGRLARRRTADNLPAGHPPQPDARRSSPGSRSPSPARSASSARWS